MKKIKHGIQYRSLPIMCSKKIIVKKFFKLETGLKMLTSNNLLSKTIDEMYINLKS